MFDLDVPGPYKYVSPKAIDRDNHTIGMSMVNMTEYPYFIFKALKNQSFSLVLEETLLKEKDHGEHLLTFELFDDVDASKKNEYVLLVEIIEHGEDHEEAVKETPAQVLSFISLKNGVKMPKVAPQAVIKAMKNAKMKRTVEIPDPRLKIKDITTNGTAILEFNQNMLYPQ